MELSTRIHINRLQNDFNITAEQAKALIEYKRYWQFYKGFMWEGMEELNKAEVTLNKCRSFIDKASAKEFHKEFAIKMNENAILLEEALNDVWNRHNSKELVCELLGQIKAVLGKAWMFVDYIPAGENLYDPFGEFPDGRILVKVFSPEFIFETRDTHNPNICTSIAMMYYIDTKEKKDVVFRKVWTKDTIETYYDDKLTSSEVNVYGFIPWFEVPNLIVGSVAVAKSDLEDLIPLNVEYNLKASNVSEIIDYHSAPVTVITGASVEELDKGFNKVWSGFPEEAKVFNLTMDTDLDAAKAYIDFIKNEMHETGSMPESSFGNGMHVSNTSGVALEITFAPLTELINRKRKADRNAIPEVNKAIIAIMLHNKMVNIPDLSPKDKYHNEIIFENFLPKDALVELQCIQLEMKLGLLDRTGAMKRLGRADIENTLTKIDKDRADYPDIYMGVNDGENILKRGLNENNEGNDSEVNGGSQNKKGNS